MGTLKCGDDEQHWNQHHIHCKRWPFWHFQWKKKCWMQIHLYPKFNDSCNNCTVGSFENERKHILNGNNIDSGQKIINWQTNIHTTVMIPLNRRTTEMWKEDVNIKSQIYIVFNCDEMKKRLLEPKQRQESRKQCEIVHEAIPLCIYHHKGRDCLQFCVCFFLLVFATLAQLSFSWRNLFFLVYFSPGKACCKQAALSAYKDHNQKHLTN